MRLARTGFANVPLLVLPAAGRASGSAATPPELGRLRGDFTYNHNISVTVDSNQVLNRHESMTLLAQIVRHTRAFSA